MAASKSLPSNAHIAIGFLKQRRPIKFIQHISLKSLYAAAFTVKSPNKILFAETQNAINQSRFTGMRHLTISTGCNQTTKAPATDFNSFK